MASLCETCASMREVVTPRGSRFLLCRLSQTDPAFPKYPPQPVLHCDGYQPREDGSDAEDAGPVGRRDDVRWEVHRVADLTAGEQAALRSLSLAVYPPEASAGWPGQAVEWAPHQWGVVGWGADGVAGCYVGVVLRQARWNERAVRVGGIGGVKTHPASRKRGFATTAVRRALDLFHEQGDVDFGLLVCEPGLVPFYARLGWRAFPGDLFVTQHQATVPFTFNLPMTIPIRLHEPLGGTIDLLGPPW